MRGQQIRDIIALCGLSGETAQTIQGAIAFALGIDVPIGSVRRALSRARGTWGGNQNVITVYDDVFEKGEEINLLHSPSSLLDTSGLYLWRGNVVGGADVIADMESHGGGLPASYHYGSWGFNVAKGSGTSISQPVRDVYEAALAWVYFTLGIDGFAAREWLDEALDAVEEWLTDDPVATPLTPLYTNGAGNLTIAEAWELLR